jgi:hypothetical protein
MIRNSIHITQVIDLLLIIENAKQLAYNRNGIYLSKYFTNSCSALLWKDIYGLHHLTVLNIQTRGVHSARNIKDKNYIKK